MLWIYVLIGTAGLVALVPTVLRATDGLATDFASIAIGFGATTFALVGLLLLIANFTWLTSLIAALALGLAAGAVSPEVVAALTPGHSTHDTALARDQS